MQLPRKKENEKFGTGRFEHRERRIHVREGHNFISPKAHKVLSIQHVKFASIETSYSIHLCKKKKVSSKEDI